MLRVLTKSDINQLLVIESSVHIAPWTAETFKACLEAGCLGWVSELNQKIIGFIMMSLNKDECHILNLGIAHVYQHQGFGLQLLLHALREAKKKGVGIAYLEVRRSNKRAISLYRKTHFQLIGERKNYYPTVNGKEDALVFAKNLLLEK